MSLRQKLGSWLMKRSGTSNPSQWLIDWVSGGGASSTGVTVNAQKALKYTPFWAAVRIISGTVGALPFKVYRRETTNDRPGKKAIPDHPVYRLLHDRPNPYMDALTFLESRQAHVLTYGNGYAEIERDGAGRPLALWPLLPDQTTRRISPAGVPYYEVRLPAGGTVNLADANVLHIKGLGFDGFVGYDVVTYHKEALGYGIGVKEYGARFFGNNASPGGVIEHPNAMGEKAHANLRKSWEEIHEGLENAHRVAILEEGAKWHEYSIDPSRAQALEVQKWTVDDCARIFQIPPHMLGSMEFSKYNNVEELRIDFLTMTMLYWFRKWEQEVNYKLLMPSEQSTLFCEILVDALLRGNVAARTAFYASGRQWGYLSINDIREKENLNPIGPAGDVYLDPLNMAPAGSLPDPQAEPPAPEPSADDDPPDDQDDPVRSAHRDLLIAQWRRIITKQNNADPKGTLGEDWWKKHRLWAREILKDPLLIYATSRGVRQQNAIPILAETIDGWISNKIALDPDYAPRSLANELMQRIGGDHHA